MKISLLNKYVQLKAPEPVKEHLEIMDSKEKKNVINKNKVDSSEISASHSGSFEDRKLSIAKSSILYEVSVGSSPAKIASLKSAVENGTYKISADDLAETILKK